MLLKVRELYSYRDFFLLTVRQQLAQRYQGSFLGLLWTLLNPALIYLSFTFIFSKLNHWDMRDYGMYFFSGYLVWTLFAGSCMASAESVVGNSAYVTRIYAPRALFPLVSVAVNMVDLAASFPVLIILAALFGNISWTMLFVPVSLAITLLFVAGIALLCAWWNVILRDFRHLLASALFIWFFCSPILWRASTMPADVQVLVWTNPMVPFLHLFQDPIWAGKLPSGVDIGLAVLMASVALVVGFAGFTRAEKSFYYYL